MRGVGTVTGEGRRRLVQDGQRLTVALFLVEPSDLIFGCLEPSLLCGKSGHEDI